MGIQAVAEDAVKQEKWNEHYPHSPLFLGFGPLAPKKKGRKEGVYSNFVNSRIKLLRESVENKRR